MSAEAKIKVGIDGLEESIGGMARLRNSVESAIGDAPKNWSKLGESIGASVKTGISDIGRLVNVANGITFVGSIESARQFRQETTRMSIATGEGIKAIQTKIDTLASRHIIAPERVVAVTEGMRKMTNDAGYATAAFGGLADEAMATGRSAEDMAPLGATLHNVMGISGDTTEALGKIRASAEAFGNVGGPAALQDSLVALNGIMGQLDLSTAGARDKMVAFAAAMQGTSKDPGAGARKVQAVMGKIQSDPLGLMRTLGMKTSDMYDAEGHMKNPLEVMKKVQELGKKHYGKGEQGQRAFINTFGAEAGISMFNHDFDKDIAASKSPGSKAAGVAAEAYANSAAGKSEKQQIDVGIQARQMAEPVVGKLDEIKNLLAKHPLVGGLAAQAGAGLLGSAANALISGGFQATSGLVGSAASGLGGMLGLGGGGAAAGGAGAAAGGIGAGALALGALGVGAAGAVGYGAGRLLDNGVGWASKKLGGSGRDLSDMLAGTQGDGFHADSPEDQARDAARLAKSAAAAGPAFSSAASESSADNAPAASSNLSVPGGNGNPAITINVTSATGPIDVMTSHKNATVHKQ